MNKLTYAEPDNPDNPANRIGEWEFDAHDTSDLSDYQRVEEMVREKIFLRLNQELPYLVTQSNEKWKGNKVTQI